MSLQQPSSTIRDFALYINGIYRSVLDEALAVQEEVPEQVVYLQPHKSHRIKELAEHPPTPDNPVQLLASTTDELNSVQYAGEIIGWRDKREVSGRKREYLDKLIKAMQPWETGLYAEANGIECVNLLSVRNLRRLSEPFPVSELVNARRDGELGERTQAGGWVYVRPDSVPQGAA